MLRHAADAHSMQRVAAYAAQGLEPRQVLSHGIPRVPGTTSRSFFVIHGAEASVHDDFSDRVKLVHCGI